MAHAYCHAMQAILVVIEGDIVTLSVLGCAGYILTSSSRKVPCALRVLQVAGRCEISDALYRRNRRNKRGNKLNLDL